MFNEIDKAIAMSLLKQAAERKLTNQALELMIRTPPRGASVDWLVVGESLENLIGNTLLDDPAASHSMPMINTNNKALVTSLLKRAWGIREEKLLENN